MTTNREGEAGVGGGTRGEGRKRGEDEGDEVSLVSLSSVVVSLVSPDLSLSFPEKGEEGLVSSIVTAIRRRLEAVESWWLGRKGERGEAEEDSGREADCCLAPSSLPSLSSF